jgi:hypothetical protein
MSVLLSMIAALVIGGGLTGYWLSTRWRQQITAAETALAEIAAQHKQRAQTTGGGPHLAVKRQS